MNPPKIGLLPLYVTLYDEVLPDLAARVEPFAVRVQRALRSGGLAVVAAPLARTSPEVARAITDFETADVDAVVTLHLAYSPSLEAAGELARTALPVVMLDTTPDRDFGRDVDPARLLQNHGIHGVQDLASVLRRRNKPYRVVAGHLDDGTLIPRVIEVVRAARAARCLSSTKALRVGGVFPGMGDFAVSDAVLEQKLGIRAVTIPPSALSPAVEAVTDDELAAELDADHQRYQVDCSAETHARSVRVGLGLRRYLDGGAFSAFSLNFLAFQEATGAVNTVPFLECCNAMARGIGYAGEGDVLTAALVGALLHGFGSTTFTEMFCADWAGQSLFLSHMGEINPAESAARPLLYEKEYPFSPALNPATLACCLRPGAGTLVNLAPGPDDTFRLITAPVEILADGTHPDLKRCVRAWIRPQVPIPRFLEEYSHFGGTHHGALMLGDHASGAVALSAFLKLEHCPIA